jgi:hypothetical protein
MRHRTEPLVCALLVVAQWAAAQTTITVGPGRDYATIQSAVDAATTGDTVVVYPGVYYENVMFRGRNIVLRSSDPASATIIATTIIDARSSGAVVTVSEGLTSRTVVEGFTIRNSGYFQAGVWPGPVDFRVPWGYAPTTSATVRNNVFTSHVAAVARCGAVENNRISQSDRGIEKCLGRILNNQVSGAQDAISGCDGLIEGNSVTSNSGGVSSCNGFIRRNLIAGNSGGGLISCWGTIEENRIVNNSADVGGGIYYGGSIRRNLIMGNRARSGGGIANARLIEGNLIAANVAEFIGGGISGGDTVRNNLIVLNLAQKGGGIEACFHVENCTFYANEAIDRGGAVWGGSTLSQIENCILWANTASREPEVSENDLPRYSIVQGLSGGVGNLAEDPMFINPDGPDGDPFTLEDNDYHLMTGSPAIDAGNPLMEWNDACRPPGLGAVRNDMGAYGGPFNCIWEQWTPLLPDLVGRLTKVEPHPLGGGMKLNLTGEIRNRGGSTTGEGFWVDFLGTNVDTGSTTRLIDPLYIGARVAGDGFDLMYAYQVVGLTVYRNIPTGSYRVTMRIDVLNQVHEADESNNLAVWDPAALVIDRPNLAVLDFEAAPRRLSPAGGDPISLRGVLVNNGAQYTLTSFRIQLTASPGYAYLPGAPVLAEFIVPERLAPSERFDLSTLAARPGNPLAPGVYTAALILDSQNVIEEQTEADNVAWFPGPSRRIQVGPPKLSVTRWYQYR